MARPLRIEYAGAVYHVTSRGNEKKPVFKDDTDRYNFLNTLQHVNKRYNRICHVNPHIDREDNSPEDEHEGCGPTVDLLRRAT